MTKKLIITLTLAALTSNSFAALHNKLHKVETKIKNTRAELRSDEQQHYHLQKKLQDYETTLSQLDNELAELEKNIEDKANVITQTQAEIQQLSEQYLNKKHTISLFIQRYYHSVQHNNWQATLDRSHALKQQRMAHYQHDIQDYLHNQLIQLNHTKEQLALAEQKLHTQVTDLTTLRDQLTREQQRVVQHHQQRATLLKTLAEKIKNEQQQLAELQANKEHMEKIILKLKRTKRHNAKYFRSHQHKMPWPVQGEHITEFDGFIPKTNLPSNAVVIKAPQMTPIKAIAPGIVAFAEWMPGFGLLIILDHGGGYMSIYGHNATIKHKVGDHIKAGEVIGNVGSSGGLANPELYFSIRHNGKPLNPALWCT